MKDPKIFKPEISSGWHVLYKPEKTGCYINDHTIIKAKDGDWHLVGITKATKEIDADNERYFSYGRGSRLALDTPFEEMRKVCDYGATAWAPCIIEHNNHYHMYYGPSPTRYAVSPDMSHWMLNPVNLAGAPDCSCHRDHMVIKVSDDTWLMYVTGIDDKTNGVISVLESKDLINWRFVQFALRTTETTPFRCPWGQMESPFVMYYEGWYYLSVTCTSADPASYHNTLLFRSKDPYDFGEYTEGNEKETVIQKLHAHAPEYLFNKESDKWFITTCGWYEKGIPNEGCVSIAELEWVAKDGNREMG